MISPQRLVDAFALNLRIILLHTEGLSQEESLVQTPYNINSLNWVLGHIAVNRDNVLRLLGEEPLLDDEQTGCYKRGSEPVQKMREHVLELEKLLEILQRNQESLSDTLLLLTPEELDAEIQVGETTTTVGQRLFGFYFHDTYHTGQTDILRQVAGKNDQIIV